MATSFAFASMLGICATHIMHSRKTAIWPIHKMCSCFCYKTCDPVINLWIVNDWTIILWKEKLHHCCSSPRYHQLAHTPPSVHYVLETSSHIDFTLMLIAQLCSSPWGCIGVKANVLQIHVAKSWREDGTVWYRHGVVYYHTVHVNKSLSCLLVWLYLQRSVLLVFSENWL